MLSRTSFHKQFLLICIKYLTHNFVIKYNDKHTCLNNAGGLGGLTQLKKVLMTYRLKIQNSTMAAVIEVQLGWEGEGRAMHNFTVQRQLPVE